MERDARGVVLEEKKLLCVGLVAVERLLRDSDPPSVVAQRVVGDSRRYGWPGRVAQPTYSRQEARFSQGALVVTPLRKRRRRHSRLAWRASRRLHANCHLAKPVDLQEFIHVVRAIEQFWLRFVKLPGFA